MDSEGPPTSLQEARQALQDLDRLPPRARCLLPQFALDLAQAQALVARLEREGQSLPERLSQAQAEVRRAKGATKRERHT